DPDAVEAERFQNALELKFPLPDPGPGDMDGLADTPEAQGLVRTDSFFDDAPPTPHSPARLQGSASPTADNSRLRDLEFFLQEISLLADTDGLKATQEAVTLMTVHSAKGLEFPRVFVTGLEDGLFPTMRRDGADGDGEGERRLVDVAGTRAREELNLSYAHRRRRYGMYQESMGSRFFREIDKQYLQIARPAAYSGARGGGVTGGGGGGGYGGYRGGGLGTSGGRSSDDFGSTRTPDYEDFSQEAEIPFRKGQRVRHAKFGDGAVVATDGAGETARVHVQFMDNIRRVLLIKYAKLESI